MGSQEQDLHMAVRKGDRCAMEKLLSRGTDINCLFYGWTPLQLAVNVGNQEMATLLINAGCQFECHDKNDCSPLEEAVLKKQAKVVDAMLKKNVSGDVMMTGGETPLTYAAKMESSDLLNALVQGGVDVNRCNSQDHTALYVAAENGSGELMQTLIAAGADINCTCGKESSTPLIAAVASENKRVVSLLSQQPGCNLNYQDSDGWTALWHAYSNANYNICSILLRAGANKNIPNHDGCTVVEDAKDAEEEVMMELFQKYNNLV